MNLYELSEIADKRFSHGEEIPQNAAYHDRERHIGIERVK